MSRITLTAPAHAGGPGMGTALAIDLIWAVSDAHDHVEHVSAQASPGRIEIGVFTVLPSPATAHRLARRACERSTALRGWTWSTPGS